MKLTIYTVGHSNHAFDSFLVLLKQHSISFVVDVRSKPFSRFTHFQRANLAPLLRANSIDYRYGGTYLGGREEASVKSKLFILKMEQIIDMAKAGERVALMCSEGKPCECHRAGKLTAWLHRAHPEIETKHIMRDGSLVDGVSHEPSVLQSVWHEEFERKLP